MAKKVSKSITDMEKAAKERAKSPRTLVEAFDYKVEELALKQGISEEELLKSWYSQGKHKVV